MKKKITVFIFAVLLCMLVLTPINCFADDNDVSETSEITNLAESTETEAPDETEDVVVISNTSETAAEVETSASASTTYPKKGFESFKNYSLPILLFGMAGIFIVLGLRALCIWLLGKYSNKSNDNKKV